MDATEAFLNDPYDSDGPKEPRVCPTEGDMDGALTMQILKSISGTPVLFADVRHYHADLGIWDLCNSGKHAIGSPPVRRIRSRTFVVSISIRRVSTFPPAASVHHLAAAEEFTSARLTRFDGRYRMHVPHGALEQFDAPTNERLMRAFDL